MRGVHSQIDWQVADALVTASHSVSFIFNFLHDGWKLHKLLALGMKKFTILHWPIDELENERSPGHNTWASGQEISENNKKYVTSVDTRLLSYLPSHKILQYRRFSSRLSTNNSNLRQVYGVWNSKLGEDILHPIHNRDEGLHTRVARHLDAVHSQLFPVDNNICVISVHVTADNMRLRHWQWPQLGGINTW